VQVTQAGHCGQHALPDLWAAVDTHLEAGDRQLHDIDARFKELNSACDICPCKHIHA
jgi:hypothetical protein